MRILVLNAGSSSLKFEVWETDPERRVAHDEVERVGDMDAALQEVFAKTSGTVDAVGHRVVHGGDYFDATVLIDDDVEHQIEKLCELAPLHNPQNLAAIRAAKKHWPNVPHAAVFDTAFHRTLPPRAYVYALPYEYLTEKKIRRYGFHGISHQYVTQRFAELHGKSTADYRLITCHLGNGCSVCAIDRGRSIDTSMGFTPLEGLVMGTRSGDVDGGAILHLMASEGKSTQDVLHILNDESGLKGLSGVGNDMRDVLRSAAEGNERAELAVETFCYRARKYIGSYVAAMNGADALIFTGGIGENSAEVRARICNGLSALGITVDDAPNSAENPDPHRIGSSNTEVWVVPTSEELLIARETMNAARLLP